ncbi:MAG: hypothetical protein IPL79_02645 [Myxococcales bacterium]|nr:hypothetical protein [Myxococcales bacterium]
MALGRCAVLMIMAGCAPATKRAVATPAPSAAAPHGSPAVVATPHTGGTSYELPGDWTLARDDDAGQELARGEACWDLGDVACAGLAFEAAIALAPNGGAAQAARWYLGHIYTYIDRQPLRAADRYLEIVAAAPATTASRKAHLAAAAALAEAKAWPRAVQVLADALARDDLAFDQRVEALARRGYVHLTTGALDEAEADLRTAIKTWQGAPRIDDPYFVAMAHNYLGDTMRERFRRHVLRQPLSELKVDLDAKRRLLLLAYDAYRQTLAFRTPYWATAAGYAMADLFYEYFQVATSIPLPANWSSTQAEAYRQEVWALVAENLHKARDGHLKNVELSDAYGVSTEWSRASALRAAQIDVAIASYERQHAK